MIYKNALFHNVAELIANTDGSISWKRIPSFVHSNMEIVRMSDVAYNSTGVEIRFVLKGDSAVIRMSAHEEEKNRFNSFHIYRGGIQGGWQDHEVYKFVGSEPENFVIEKSRNMERLKIMSEKCGYNWSPEVIRIIFDRGRYKIYDISGNIEPPSKEQCPKNTLLAYGSSITHGSNSIDMSHSWVSLLAYNLNMDSRNLGMAGACALEPEMAEYIALEGERGNWDIATLELGINVMHWEEAKIRSRTENLIKQVAIRNPTKPIFIISPFFYCGEYFDGSAGASKWRSVLEKVVNDLNFANVTYINGLDILSSMEYISADEVHPNIYAMQRIADILTVRIRECIVL